MHNNTAKIFYCDSSRTSTEFDRQTVNERMLGYHFFLNTIFLVLPSQYTVLEKLVFSDASPSFRNSTALAKRSLELVLLASSRTNAPLVALENEMPMRYVRLSQKDRKAMCFLVGRLVACAAFY